MKRQGYLYEQMCSFPTLYAASHRALKGHKSHAEAAEFCFNLDRELDKLQRELQENTYQPQEYHYFEIYEPKQRTISVASFRDRVVHHALIGMLEPYFEKSFIYHSYATRKNKGSLAAVKQAQKFLKRYDWYLKLDISKYFDSIDHQVLMSLIERKIKDARVLELCAKILATSVMSSDHDTPIGLPIGNLSSQFFANVYLDSFDHFVLEHLRFPMLRYMDDILLFADDKASLKSALKAGGCYLQEKLHLKIKEGSVLLNTRVHGLSFLGFRIFPKLIRMKSCNIKRMVAKIKLRQYEYKCGVIDESALYRSVQSMLAFADYADSCQLLKRISCTLG